MASTDRWAQHSLGIDLPRNLDSVSSADVEFVCNKRYPFLQVINSDAIFAEEATINFITTANGWLIHDYGDAVSVSAPHNEKKQEGSTAEQTMVVMVIADLIATKGWQAAELIAGTKKMTFFLWIYSKRFGFELKGFDPTEEDEKKRERIMKLLKESWAMQVKTLEPAMAGAA